MNNLDEQIHDFMNRVAPAISLDDITSRSDAPYPPQDREDLTMTTEESQHDLRAGVDDSSVIVLDRAAAKRRSSGPIWAGAAVAAAAIIAVVGYFAGGIGNTPESVNTVTASELSDGFTESDADGNEASNADDAQDEAESAAEGEMFGDMAWSNGTVIATDDGFVNIVTTESPEGPGEVTATRSTDGETWEPAQVSGLGDASLWYVDQVGDSYVAKGSEPFDPAEEFFGPMRGRTWVSDDGLNWTELKGQASEPIEGWIDTSDLQPVILPNGSILALRHQMLSPDHETLDLPEECNEGYGEGFGDETGQYEIKCGESVIKLDYPEGHGAGPQTALLLFEADGSTFVPVEIPGAGELFDLSADSDGAVVQFMRADSTGGEAAARSADGKNWETVDLPPGDVVPYAVARWGTSAYGLAESGLLASNDGGRSWTKAADLPGDKQVMEVAAGPAGVVVTATDADAFSPEFDYEAPDGTRLQGREDGGETPWILTTPDGQTLTYEGVSPYVSESPVSSASEESVTETAGGLVRVEQNEFGAPKLTFTSPDDGAELLTVDMEELWNTAYQESVGDEDFVFIIERDGYVLELGEGPESSSGYTLRDGAGAVVAEGGFDDMGNPVGDGVEVTGVEDWSVAPTFRFFDPETGADIVTFGSEELMSAFMAQTEEMMAEQSSPFETTSDGYRLAGSYPAGEWTVTSPDGDEIARFESPDADLFGGLEGAAESSQYTQDRLTGDITILNGDGKAVVTFTGAQIAEAAGAANAEDGWEATTPSSTLFFSSDQGQTWIEVTGLANWASSMAVGDDEVLLSLGDGDPTPVRVALPVN